MNSPDIHFVISAPRSGSTWLAAALNQHPEVFATEQRLFGNFCELWPNNNGNLAPRMTFDSYARALSVHYFHEHCSESRQQFTDDFISEYARFLLEFAQRKTGKSIIVDKVTPYPGTAKVVVDKIKKHFPSAKIIQLIRDGRDVVTSGTFDWLLKDANGTARHDYFVKEQVGTKLNRFFDDAVLKKWTLNWHESVEVFENQLKPDLRVHYEAMLADQSKVLVKLFEVLGADSSDDVSRRCSDPVSFEKMTNRSMGQMEATDKQRIGVAGDWENYFTKRDAEIFEAIAGHELCLLGYEKDSSWVNDCPDELSLIRTTNANRKTSP